MFDNIAGNVYAGDMVLCCNDESEPESVGCLICRERLVFQVLQGTNNDMIVSCPAITPISMQAKVFNGRLYTPMGNYPIKMVGKPSSLVITSKVDLLEEVLDAVRLMRLLGLA